ncbi:XylR N-terminal domain-containing protein [Alicyclobacillus shizuokensis]|uniref:XylR N-terminal domain-containing protein n=1 Tax=Alicyclobacillus shizuokensis TaxID=392014 RepID=UPI00082D0C28|nr:XylR N-terminal domain-containing protein [Alicyclobacillus shizuokensis]MCL6625359.1 XylR N-terminal domain-containing protein [Alicyclobacillus shizuokensis]
MKARELLLERLMDIDRRNGTIRFNDKRMTLISVEALGILRRDLASTLGMERAKGFLMRYGWACGQHDAQSIQTMFSWDSERELYLAGPTLHTLEGTVTVEPWELHVDKDSHTLYFTGEWRNSYEVDEHVRHFGMSDEPVCYTLLGYASGYLSEIFGEPVLVTESKCRGKGDSQCVYVAKSLANCSEQERQMFRYFEAESLATELDLAYRRLHHLNQTLIQSLNLHRRLSELVFEGKNLSIIVQVIQEVMQRSVVLEGRRGQLLLSSWHETSHRFSYTSWKRQDNPVPNRESPVGPHVQCEVDGVCIDAFVILANRTRLGRLVLVGDSPIAEEAYVLVERALNVCAVQMFYEQLLLKDSEQKIGDFLDGILQGSYSEQEIAYRARMLDLNPEDAYRVMAVRVEPEEQQDDVLELIRNRFQDFHFFSKGCHILGLICCTKVQNPPWDLEKLCQSIVLHIRRRLKAVSVSVGCGRMVSSMSDIGNSYEDAKLIADWVLAQGHSTPTCGHAFGIFEGFQTVLMLVKSVGHPDVMRFYESVLGRLVQYDAAHRGELLPTLRTYLEHTGNIRRVASELYVSETGVRYRVGKIQELCGLDLNRGHDRFVVQMALQIHDSLSLAALDPRIGGQGTHHMTLPSLASAQLTEEEAVDERD